MDSLDTFGFHKGFVGLELLFEPFGLFGFERSSRIALDAAHSFAARRVTAKRLGQQLRTDDFILDLDHFAL